MPFLAHGMLGIEFVAVTTFEARNPRKSLRGPSRYIAYIMFFLFLLCGIGETLNITWDAKGLPEMSNSRLKSRTDDTATLKHTPSILVLSAEQAMDYRLAAFFTGCLIYSALSAANTALYVASRTLYGLCRELSEDDERLPYRLAAKLGTLDRRTRVPLWSIVVSVFVFCWIPFLHVAKKDSTDEVSISPIYHPLSKLMKQLSSSQSSSPLAVSPVYSSGAPNA
jgi:amino acid transporter